LVRQSEGIVKSDRSQLDNAKLQLAYSRITAPISGRVGLRLVDPGNMVRATDTNGLLVITQLTPIAVIFTIPEDNLPAVLERVKDGRELTVDAFDREQKKKLATGSLLTVDNQIDPNTGTVRLKAVFPNEDSALFPNQFVNARLLLEVQRDLTIVPSAAVQRGAKGTFVYVVKEDRTVAVRPVVVGVAHGDDTSISSGLLPDELVVVDGTEKLREGSKVDIRNQGDQPTQGADTSTGTDRAQAGNRL
jgi:multidrug efflux system membrane fusion protein